MKQTTDESNEALYMYIYLHSSVPYITYSNHIYVLDEISKLQYVLVRASYTYNI